MSSSFLVRDISVEVDTLTWGDKPLPAQLKGSSGINAIDVGDALHMLGTLTMPNLLSPASPALFWAWLRYYLAPTDSKDLRITMAFADLDPHQKSILSDDLGVAIATKWLNDRFGGFKKIIDGRRFVLQFKHLLRDQHNFRAKIGQNKCPDFVMEDKTGRWHILECKGTQTRSYRNAALRTAIHQKRAIRLSGNIKGEQLASALYIANKESEFQTHLKIIDPIDDSPILSLSSENSSEMDKFVNRVSVARAFGMIGLDEVAMELSFPPDVSSSSDLLLPSEAIRLKSPRETRYSRVTRQLRESSLSSFTNRGTVFRGREARFELPPTDGRIPFRSIIIRQGVAQSLIDGVLSLDSAFELFDERVSLSDSGIRQDSEEGRLLLTYDGIMFSELTWE